MRALISAQFLLLLSGVIGSAWAPAVGADTARSFPLSGGTTGGALRIIADTDTPVPGQGGGTFQTFFQLNGVDPDISGRNVVFAACCPTGVYGWFDGELRVIADINTPFPGTGNPMGFDLTDGSGPTISGRNVAFACSDGQPGPSAICAYINGSLEVVVKAGVTVVPGTTETFRTFFTLNGTGPSISGENVAFTGSSLSFNGIYARINGELITIADNTTPVPGEQGVTFLNFGQLRGNSPSISGENVVFVGFWIAGGGVYAYINGELRVIADTNTPVPGGTGNFLNPGPPCGARPSIDGENIAFAALFPGGVYAYINGELRAVANGTTPGPAGGTVVGGAVAPGISGENIAFGGGADGIGVGIFAYIDGQIELIASRNSLVPGHEDTTFEQFFLVDWPASDGEGVRASISGENVVFMGNGRLPGKQNQFITGIYARIVEPPIPVASQWGVVLMALVVVTAGAVLIHRRRSVAGGESET